MASPWTHPHTDHTQLTPSHFTRNGRILGLFSDSGRSTTTEFPQGLDPVQFIKLSRQGNSSGGKKQRRKNRRRLAAQESSYGSKKKRRKEILEINKVPRAEFLIPGRRQYNNVQLHFNFCHLKKVTMLSPTVHRQAQSQASPSSTL